MSDLPHHVDSVSGHVGCTNCHRLMDEIRALLRAQQEPRDRLAVLKLWDQVRHLERKLDLFRHRLAEARLDARRWRREAERGRE